MVKIIGMLTVLLLAPFLAACGDDDEPDDVAAFCAELERADTIAPTLGTAADVTAALGYIRGLQADAPEEIEDDLETLAQGLENMAEAFEEFEGVEGEEALEAVQEAADVDFDELSAAAAEVEEFAAENCEDFEPEGAGAE